MADREVDTASDKIKTARKVPGALEDIDYAVKELKKIRNAIEATEAKVSRRKGGKWWFNSFSDTLKLIAAFFTHSTQKVKDSILDDLDEDLRHLLDQADSIRANAEAAATLLGRFKNVIDRAIEAYEKRETKPFIDSKMEEYRESNPMASVSSNVV